MLPLRHAMLVSALLGMTGGAQAAASEGSGTAAAQVPPLLSATGDTPHAEAVPLVAAPASSASAVRQSADGAKANSADNASQRHFVASDASIQVLLDALSGGLKRPIVASALVRVKHVTGVFDLTDPRALLRQLGETMSLLWYDDGSSLYIYDNSEIKNAVVSMQHATLGNVRDFIRETHLYDSRFPLRGDDLSGTFYLTGAPVYVNLVTAAAKYLDHMRATEQSDRPIVKVVRLHNSFVNDRTYTLRDRNIVIPGIATVLGQIYGGGAPAHATQVAPGAQVGAGTAPGKAAVLAQLASSGAARPASSGFSLLDSLPQPGSAGNASAAAGPSAGGDGNSEPISAAPGVRAVAYPDTNSLVLVGDIAKVQDMEQLIRTLDLANRQIELSLWIIDVEKGKLARLGINWQGAMNRSDVTVGFNGGTNLSTLNGEQFLASIHAMNMAGDAQIVSRPIVLTQENVPAIFDNNQTFYAQLVGDHTAQLDHVTYGTMISVLPRLSEEAKHVEMQVDVEDGNAGEDSLSGQTSVNGLPLVNRTEIHTVARVPAGKSLLIGGNTIDHVVHTQYKIPLLGSIPWLGALFRGHTDRHDQVVRLYLIQPRLLTQNASWQDGQDWLSSDPAQNAMLRSTVQLLQPYMDQKQ